MDHSSKSKNQPLLEDVLLIKNEFISNKNKQKKFINHEQKEMIELLVLMGFNFEMIDMCFCFFTIQSIEQAVQMMSKENEIWQHNYIQSEDNLCIICNEYSNHINLILDKEERIQKLKEINDSFNSKYRSSIDHLRENNANRKSDLSIHSKKSIINPYQDQDSENIFEINLKSNENINTLNINRNNNGIYNKHKTDGAELKKKNSLLKNDKSNNHSKNISISFEENDLILPIYDNKKNSNAIDNTTNHDILNVSDMQNILEETKAEGLKKDNNKISDENFENKECDVCLMNIEKGNILFNCKHLFCNDCWIAYIKDKIDCNQIKKISCMMQGCDLELKQKDINKILESISDLETRNNLKNKYQKFQTENNILNNKNLKLCPIPDCGGHASLSNKKSGNVLTCNNNHNFCLKCLNPAHPKKNCDDVLDDYFKKWRTGKIIKKCPNCKFWTEKNAGCNHMTCRGCQYQWCWVCSAKYTKIHYRFGFCDGLQFVENDNMIHSNCWRFKNYMKKGIYKLLLRILIQFFIMLLFGSYIISFRKYRKGINFNYINKFAENVLFLSMMFAAIAFHPLVIGLSIIYVIIGIILSIFLPCYSGNFVEYFESLVLCEEQ